MAFFVAAGAALVGAAASSALAPSGGGGGGGQASQLADPFQASRPQYAQMLNQYMANPSQFVQQQPGYQFQYQQGLDALMRQQAASGMSASGNSMLAAQKYGQDYASAQSSNLFNELAQLSGGSWQSGPAAANAMLAGQAQQYGMGSNLGQAMGGLAQQGIQQYFGSQTSPVDMTGFQNTGYQPSYNWGGGSTSPTINIGGSDLSGGAYFGGGIGDYSVM